MDIGIALPSMVAGFGRDDVLAWLAAVDAGPFSTVSAGERIGYHTLEMMSVLSAAAVATSRVRILATVSVTPMHPAVLVAKQAATIDVLSGGRFSLGVGVGGREDDYRLLEAPFTRRHPRLDEQVATIRAVWAGEVLPGGDGRERSGVGPPPVQPGGPPILSGSMGPKGMARAARWADGLAGFDMSADADSIARSAAAFDACWKDAARGGKPFQQSSAWFSLRADGAEVVRDYAFRYLQIFGDDVAHMLADTQRLHSTAAVRDALRAIADTGIDEFLLVATSTDVDEVKRAADVIASL